jgi:deazaflavin-dependent oxidoreductase (nitroreductase family)
MTVQGTYVPSKQQWVRDQVEEFEASDGGRANTLRRTGDPIVVITSVGAKSGNLRKNPVMRVERDGAYVAIASVGGSPKNPEWYHNFLAHPEVELQDGAERHTYHARLLTGDERTEWWEYAVATWPTYAEYQKRTEREIPVFLLERLA